VIGKAKGILMAREQCSADEAFGLLRGVSQRTNRKLREVAQGVVDSVCGSNGSGG
jgi:AmiR/NasT family two-component response regulator